MLFSSWCFAQTTQNNPISSNSGGMAMSKELFDIISQWQSLDQGQAENLLSFVESNTQLLAVRQEAVKLVDEFDYRILYGGQDRGDGQNRETSCACSVYHTLTDTGTAFNYQDFEQIDTQKRKEFLFKSRMNGAAHSSKLTRFIKHNINSIESNTLGDVTVKTELVCMGANGNTCSGSCTGEMTYIGEYHGKARVYTETSFGPLSASHSLSSDAASLTYDTTYGDLDYKFNKGYLINKEESMVFDVGSLVTFITGSFNIVAAVVGEDGSIAEIDGQMIDDVITGLFGIFTNNGDTGALDQEFKNEYYSETEPPELIYPGNISILKLTSHGHIKGRGWGGSKSWSEASYGSSFSLAGTVKNFSCDTDVLPPNENGFWSYGNADGPLGLLALKNHVIANLGGMIPGFNKQDLVEATSHFTFTDYGFPVEIGDSSLRIQSKPYNKCMYPYGWGGVATVRFHTWNCSLGDNFAFNAIDAGTSSVKLQSQMLNLCVLPNSGADGSFMKAVDCSSSGTIFNIVDTGIAGEFRLRNATNGKCLYAGSVNGAEIKQRGCSSSSEDMIFRFLEY